MSGLVDAIQEASEIEELRKALRRTQIALARAKGKSAELVDAVLLAAREAYLTLGKPAAIAKPKRDARPGGEVALWHLTDWQTGKKTISYDMATMDERVRRFAAKAVSITNIMRADHPVKRCQVLFGGDMVENTQTFPGQAWEVEATTFTQLFTAANTAEAILRHALANYEHVDVLGEPGNHGRLGKPSDGAPRGDNWDRVLYTVVAERFASEKRITFTCEDNWHQRFAIGNYKGVLVHGDEFKSFGGNTPMHGILRKCNAWKSGVIPAFDDVYVGHYHNSNDLAMSAGGEIFMTGSTESDNQYAAEFVAAMAAPSQRLHFVDPLKGRVTAKYKIDLS